jgi:protein-disulfide isomerase
VTIVEFSDFQCPFCSKVTPTLTQIKENHGKEVRVIFRQLPLPFHKEAKIAAKAALAAHRQGKFWEMHDKLFADQQSLSEAAYEKHAKDLGLDVERFKKDYASAEVKARVDADMREANQLGVNGTPGFFVNGRFLSGAQPFEAFKALIDQELAQAG